MADLQPPPIWNFQMHPTVYVQLWAITGAQKTFFFTIKLTSDYKKIVQKYFFV